MKICDKDDRELTAFKRKYIKFVREKRRLLESKILFEPNLRSNKPVQIYIKLNLNISHQIFSQIYKNFLIKRK